MREVGLRIRRWMQCAGLLWAAAFGCHTSQAQTEGSTAPTLTVWIVRPVTAADRAVQQAQADLQAISTYQESTAGSFGTASSEAGQTASSYGTSASNVGRNASSVGTTAGSYGQTASSLPSDVTSQTAGSYGTTAGSIGTNASDYTGAPTKASEEQRREYLLKQPEWQRFVSQARNSGAASAVTFVEVPGLALRAKLAMSASTDAYPDVLLLPRTDFPSVLIGDQPAERQQEMLDNIALVHVGKPYPWPVVRAPDAEPQHHRGLDRPFAYGLGMVRAPHPRATRAFLEWLDDSPSSLRKIKMAIDDPAILPVKAAIELTESLFAGGAAAPWADPQMAQFTLESAVSLLYEPAHRVPTDLRVETSVLRVAMDDRLALVLLQAEVVSGHAYGRFFPLLMLRRNEGGAWKVLHVSVDLAQGSAVDAYQLLATSLPVAEAQKPAQVTMVSLASPKDGEQRAAQGGLELWWDDTSNARVLVVEYQSEATGADRQPHLFVVDDREPKLQTRVSAPFVAESGPIRWRVWSVGQGGNVKMTPWQHVNLIR